jgi:predicted SAM-dependent methyltransferase
MMAHNTHLTGNLLMSETDNCRDILAPYCKGIGMDVGYGGNKIVPEAWSFDMPQPYTKVGDDRQQLRGDCRIFPFIADGALDYIYSSHLLEDFTYSELVPIIIEWRRCLKPRGLMVTNCPNQQKFVDHCAKTGQGLNLAHKEHDFSLKNFKERSVAFTGNWDVVFEQDNFGNYSWLLVLEKKP